MDKSKDLNNQVIHILLLTVLWFFVHMSYPDHYSDPDSDPTDQQMQDQVQ